MKKKNDFLQEMKNSEEFLNKLKGIKKASKDIKEKNKLVSHRNIWVKQFNYLSRLERDAQQEITNYFQDFDTLFEYEMEDKQVFGRENYKTYSQYRIFNEEELSNYTKNIWEQLHSLPILIDKFKNAKSKVKEEIDVSDISDIISDIGLFLKHSKEEVHRMHDRIMNQKLPESLLFNQEHVDEENQFFLETLLGKPSLNNVKGFDFEVNQVKRIEDGESHINQYLDTMNDKLTEDEIFQVMSEYRHANYLLRETLDLQIEKICLDYQEALNLSDDLVGISENFQKINHIYQTYIGRGKLLTLYYERLGIEFPKINRKILQRITEYIEAKIYKERKIKAVKRNYLREKQDMLAKVEKQVNIRIENKIKKAHQEAENLQRRQEKLKLEKQLQILRQEYQKRQQEKHRIIAEEQQKKNQEEKRKEAIRRLYLDDLNKKAAQIHQIKEKHRIEEIEQRKKQKQREENSRKQQIQKNKPKIQKRQSIQRKKVEKKLEQQKEKKEYNVKKEERINKAVEKYSFRPKIEPSDQRLQAPTQALKKKKETKYDLGDKIELSKATGYNINQLMGDMRFKLNTMLQQAGLSNTDYAREVLFKMSKPNQ